MASVIMPVSPPRQLRYAKPGTKSGYMLHEIANTRFFLLVLMGVILPHLFHLPWVHLAVFTLFWGWCWTAVSYPKRLPSRLGLILLTLLSGAAVLLISRGNFTLETSIGLLITGLGLKLLELKQRRDFYIAVFLAWFVTLTQFLFDQSLWMAGYAILSTLFLSAVLILQNSHRARLKSALNTAVCLFLPALPFMLILFLFFPRLPGPFWSLPLASGQAKTGLSDFMEPGAISRLSQSSEVAFRVEFQGDLPPPSQRYWRAQVFWRFDGRRWLPLPDNQVLAFNRYPQGKGREYQYTVTLEPHNQNWLFSLGVPATVPKIAVLTQDWTLRARKAIDERVLYTLKSYESYQFPPLTAEERQLALQLPFPPSQKVQSLLAQWKQQGKKDLEIAKAAMGFFRRNGFVYTLNPTALHHNFIERFLFETRQGFCEHYAAAFVYLMRVSGIPARVVGGYMGGYFNPVGNFIEVYQANAHAWAEIWIAGKGWTRFDPTQMVAPAYMEQALNMPVPGLAEYLHFRNTDGISKRFSASSDFWRKIRYSVLTLWSTLNHSWHRWVLGFDTDHQQQLWQWLQYWKSLLMVAVVAIISMLLIAWFLLRQHSRVDPVQRLYQRFLAKLSKRGISKTPSQSPSCFADKAVALCPDQATLIRQITSEYLALRYGRKSNHKQLQRLISQLN